MKLKYYLRGMGIGIVLTAIIMSFIRQPERLTDAQIKIRAIELGMVEKSVLADLQEDNESLSEKEEVKNEVSQDGTSQDEVTDVEGNSEVKDEKEEAVAESVLVSEENIAVNPKENIVVNPEENEDEIENENTEENGVTTEEQEVTVQSEKSEEENVGNITVVGSYNESTVPVSNDIPKDEVVENYVIIFLESGYSSEYASKKVKEAGLVDSWLEFNRYMVRNGLDRKIRAGNHEIPVGSSMEEIARILCRQE